jgi:pimeloyl-ACP methyl ester carboxylesterase
MPSVRARDGVELHYETAGEGPRGVLMLHAWGGAGSGHSWRQVLPHLNLRDLRLVMADTRGHGRSGGAATSFSIEQLAEDALAVAEAEAIDPLIVAGASIGGKVAQWMAARYPERVRGLVLIAPVPVSAQPLDGADLAMWLQMARERDRFSRILAAMEKPPVEPQVLRGFFDDCHATPLAALAGTFQMAVSDAGPERLGDVRARTLVVAAERDGLVPLETVRNEVAARIPGARLVTVDCGHHITLTRGREVAALLEGFLAEAG